jgi:hypothetical protein
MSDFFEWIGDVVPLFLWLILWACAAPIRLVFMLCLPYGAKYRYHWANFMYDFFAFER